LSSVFGFAWSQAGHFAKYPSGEHLNKAPPCNPNPCDVGVISIIVSHPQSEHLFFNMIVDLSGLASNIFLNISIIMDDSLSMIGKS